MATNLSPLINLPQLTLLTNIELYDLPLQVLKGKSTPLYFKLDLFLLMFLNVCILQSS